MVAYRFAACLLWGALSTSSAASSAAYRSLASNTVTVSSDSLETSASVSVRCDNEVDSTINLYVVSDDDIAGVISFGDSVSEITKGANEGCRRLNDATDPGDFDEDCLRRLKDLTDPGLSDDGTPITPTRQRSTWRKSMYLRPSHFSRRTWDQRVYSSEARGLRLGSYL